MQGIHTAHINAFLQKLQSFINIRFPTTPRNATEKTSASK